MTAPKPRDKHKDKTTEPKSRSKLAGGGRAAKPKEIPHRDTVKGTRRTARAVTKSPNAK